MNTYAEIVAAFDDITRDSGRYYFSLVQMERFMVRALTETCERARYKDAYEEIDGVAGTLEYAITSNGYDITRVEYDDEVLLPIARDALRHAERDWQQRSGRPRYYYLDEIYDEQDTLAVGVWEAPSANLTDGLRVWYHAVPTTPKSTSPSAELDIPDWAVGAVLFYMLYLAYTADTKMQNFQTAAVYKLMYDDLLDRLISRSRDHSQKHWVSGQPSGPSLHVLNRLPQRITP